MTWDFFKHYLFSPRAGSLIRIIARMSVWGVGVGVMALTIVLSVMNGFNDSIRRKLLASEPHLVVSAALEDRASIQELLPADGLESMQPYNGHDVILRSVEGNFGGAIAKGSSLEGLKGLAERIDKLYKPENRRMLSLASDVAELGDNEIIMGVDLAHSLNIFEGDQVMVMAPESLLLPAGEQPLSEKVTVKSLMTTKLGDIDSKYLFYSADRSLKRIQALSKIDHGLELRLKNPDDAATYAEILNENGFKTTTWMSRNSTLFFALRMEKIAMGIFLGLTTLITSFSIISVMALLITQKRQDMGVLMAVGLSPRSTRRQFLGMGLLLAAIGMGGGLLTGILVSLVLHYHPLDILPPIYYDSSIPATVDVKVTFLISGFCALVAAAGAWLPSRQIQIQSPSEALRSQKG
jgi:lipoprotein-releasing system permease protein